MTKPLKIWLWIVFIVNIIVAVFGVITALYQPILFLTVILELVIIIGTALLLFQQKKLGFYLLCIAAVVGMVVNIATGSNIISSILSGILMPLIVWLLMRKNWNEFQ